MAVGDLFVQLSIILIIAFLISAVIRFLKQPLIIGYIIAGIVLSPYFLGVIRDSSGISTFSQIGVAILLFMVGLGLNPRVIKDVGKVALVTGIGQILVTTLIAYGAGKLLGFSTISSIYIAIAISFSSTIIIMKLLSDKGDTETLYGKIAVGFLLVQDLVAIIILMVISSASSGEVLSALALQKLGIGAVLLIALAGITIYILPNLTKSIAKSQELLLLFSIAWALALASLFSFTGFSIEIGALIAGVSLSLSPYKYEMSSKLKPLRDFFLLIFFILIGAQMEFSNISSLIAPTIIFSLIILIGNPLIILSLMGWLGYTKRNSFLAGLTVSQISEFSFILIALGVNLGHIESNILSLMALIGLITMGGCTYFITHGDKLYQLMSKSLSFFERKIGRIDEVKRYKHDSYDIILFGYNRIGYNLVKTFKKINKKFIVIDYNPDTIAQLSKARMDCVYGDAGDSELLEEIPSEKASLIISTIPDIETNFLLISKIREKNPKANIIAVAYQIKDALSLYEAGATYVITPHFLGGAYVSHLLEESENSPDRFIEEGRKHKKEMQDRLGQGHEHPSHDRDSY